MVNGMTANLLKPPELTGEHITTLIFLTGNHGWHLIRTIYNVFTGTIYTQNTKERAIGCWQPISFFLFSGGSFLEINNQ